MTSLLQLVSWQLPSDIADSASALAVRGKLLFADKGETVLEVLYVKYFKHICLYRV
jgi:hypothetical protein